MNKDAPLHQLKTVTSQPNVFLHGMCNLSISYGEIRYTDQISSKQKQYTSKFEL